MPPSDPLSQFFAWPSTTWTPRVLKDGSDSVGALGALNRVYLNIGLFSEEWLLHFRALIGGQPISPIPIATAEKNSAYWRATEMQTPNMARFFLASTDPHHLKDAPGGDQLSRRTGGRRSERGKTVFADRCARCHSSKLPPLPAGLDLENANGPDYLTAWNAYWNWTKTDAFKAAMREIVLSATISSRATSSRRSCACRSRCSASTRAARSRPTRFAATSGTISRRESYKRCRRPARSRFAIRSTGGSYDYPLPAGGRGYIRPASLVSVWSTAPFLQNNTVGPFEWSPSVDARMRSFQELDRADAVARAARQGSVVCQRESVPASASSIGSPSTATLKCPKAIFPDRLRRLVNGVAPAVPVHRRQRLLGEDRPVPERHAGRPDHNMDLSGAELPPAEREAHKKKLLTLLKHAAKANSRQARTSRAISADLVDDMLDVSKCKDFVVNKGHYFGTDYFTEEPG